MEKHTNTHTYTHVHTEIHSHIESPLDKANPTAPGFRVTFGLNVMFVVSHTAYDKQTQDAGP